MRYISCQGISKGTFNIISYIFYLEVEEFTVFLALPVLSVMKVLPFQLRFFVHFSFFLSITELVHNLSYKCFLSCMGQIKKNNECNKIQQFEQA